MQQGRRVPDPVECPAYPRFLVVAPRLTPGQKAAWKAKRLEARRAKQLRRALAKARV